MTIHTAHRSAVLGSWLVLGCAVAAGQTDPAPGETVSLNYGPENGAVFDVVDTTTRTTMTLPPPSSDDTETPGSGDGAVVGAEAGGGTQPMTEEPAQPVVDERAVSYRVTVASDDDGYKNKAVIGMATLRRGDHPIASPVLSSMNGLELTYELDSDGSLLQISGYENLPAAMNEALPGPLAATMTRLLNYESLRRQDEDSYRRIYADLPAAAVPGELTLKARLEALPYGGTLPVFYVEQLSRADDDGAWQLRRDFHSVAASLAAMHEGIDAEAVTAAGAMLTATLPANHVGAVAFGSQTTMFDAAGLLVAAQTTELSFTLSLASPDPAGDHPQVSVIEKREFVATPVPMADDGGESETATPQP